MEMRRPDLSKVDPEVREYIQTLEAEIERLQSPGARPRSRATQDGDLVESVAAIAEPIEPPTTINLITATASCTAKRTPRHLYTRQNRGGMGVFDLETSRDEQPVVLALADESADLLLITNLARAFRLPVSAIPQKEVRDKGEKIIQRYDLLDGEQLACILADKAEGYVALLSERGDVRLLRHHVFGEFMKPGTQLYDIKTFGPLAAACRTSGSDDLFIATSAGKGIRFSEKLVPPQGGPGIRLADDDRAVAITGVSDDSGVFLLAEDGKGIIRLMSGFSANKSPGGGGKIALSTDHLVGASRVEANDDIFVISKLGKIIRFPAEQVPEKESVVQGVICMSLRGDETTALVVSESSYL